MIYRLQHFRVILDPAGSFLLREKLYRGLGEGGGSIRGKILRYNIMRALIAGIINFKGILTSSLNKIMSSNAEIQAHYLSSKDIFIFRSNHSDL